MNLDSMRLLCNRETMIVTMHCMKRITERGIGLSEIRHAILSGEVIEDYPDDFPYPSCLILGNGLHVVAGMGEGRLWLITAYMSDERQWEDDLKTRKVKS